MCISSYPITAFLWRGPGVDGARNNPWSKRAPMADYTVARKGEYHAKNAQHPLSLRPPRIGPVVIDPAQVR